MKCDARLEKTLTNKQHNTYVINYAAAHNTIHFFLSQEVTCPERMSPFPSVQPRTNCQPGGWSCVTPQTVQISTALQHSKLLPRGLQSSCWQVDWTSWLIVSWHYETVTDWRRSRRGRRSCGLNSEEVRGRWRELHNLEMHSFYPSDAMTIIKRRTNYI